MGKFELSADSGHAPFTPIITNLSENTDSFQWDFGDGSETSSAETPSHTYTKSGMFVIELSVNDGGPSMTFTQTVTVEAGPLAALRITPSEVAVAVNDTIEFSAIGQDKFGNEIGNVDLAWSSSDEAGSIDATGQFTATTKAGEYQQSVTATANEGGQQAFASVVVDPGPPFEITLEPSVVALDIGASQEIQFKVTDEFGNAISDPLSNWKIDSKIGAIDDSGVFTAGTTAGVYPEGIRVDVVEGAAAVSATIVVGVNPDSLASIRVVPPLPIVRKNETLKLKAVGSDQYGNTIPNLAFLWNSGDLNVDSTGKIIAGSQQGLYEVTVQASYRDVEKTISVNVGIPPVSMPLGDMVYRRGRNAHALLADGTVLIIGGAGSPRTAELYDPETASFLSVGNSIYRHAGGHTATVLLDGRVLIVGGCGGSVAELYDPISHNFTETADQPQFDRSSHTATLLSNGDVLFAGGKRCGGETLDSAEIYSAENDTFSLTVGKLLTPRTEHVAAALPDGDIVVMGGLVRSISGGFPDCVHTAERYSPATATFVKMSNTIQGSGCGNDGNARPITLDDGRVLVTLHHGVRAEIYDPDTGQFSLAGLWNKRGNATVVDLPGGNIAIIGGASNVEMFDLIDIYDVSSQNIIASVSMTTPRFTLDATTLASGNVLITGGIVRIGEGTANLGSAELLIPE